MTKERYFFAMRGQLMLTDEEASEGWHYCADFDGLLVGPGMGELHSCACSGAEIAKARAAQPVEPFQPAVPILAHDSPEPHERIIELLEEISAKLSAIDQSVCGLGDVVSDQASSTRDAIRNS
jgi:hypothetical protein